MLPLFRFQSLPGTASAGAVPLLQAPEQSPVALRVTNNLAFAIQPRIIGRKTAPPIQPGQTRNLEFRMPRAGMYLVTDTLLGPAAAPAGLAAMLDSRRVPDRSIIAGRDYDEEYLLLYNNSDDRWNAAIDSGMTPDTSVFEPNYHTVNGLAFPETATDPSTLIACKLGQNVLMRWANISPMRQSIHLHGYHADVIARNNRPESFLGPKDTIGLPGQSTADILLPVTQSGMFPMHPHNLTAVTDNGLYAHGQILMIDAS